MVSSPKIPRVALAGTDGGCSPGSPSHVSCPGKVPVRDREAPVGGIEAVTDEGGSGDEEEASSDVLLLGNGGARISSALLDSLYDYQREGIAWLYAALESNRGAILGDDPGLGKTLQTIALIEALVTAREATRVLIVVPGNNVGDWAAQFRRWAPELSVVCVGAEAASLHAREHVARLAAARAGEHFIGLPHYSPSGRAAIRSCPCVVFFFARGARTERFSIAS